MAKLKGETNFINEYTRHCLVNWADLQARTGAMPLDAQEPYLSYARTKGWVSKKELKVLKTGYDAAAAYLRR
jgi:hypothetical protein